jgi:uncharacterized delta-60 repeat protein
MIFTDITPLEDSAQAVAVQSDGKIVIAGTASGNFNANFALARYFSNGVLDTSFDTDGIVTTNVVESRATSISLQVDGKIVAAGNVSKIDGHNFMLARYTNSGALDASFGVSGVQTTRFTSTSDDYANGLAIQSNGKIVAIGSSYNNQSQDFAIARYNP